MSIAKVLVPLDGSGQDRAALSTAIRSAKPFAAHVVALFAHPDPAEAIPVVGVPFTAEAMRAVIDGQAELQRLAAKQIGRTLQETCKAEGANIVPSPCRDTSVTVSYREAVGYTPKVIAAAAALSDLAVLNPSAGAPRTFEAAIDTILIQRRPVLIAPEPPRPFRKIFVGWDGSAAAAHGLSAAMPYLEKAEMVELVCLQPPGRPDSATDDVASYLKAHGVICAERHLRVIGSALHKSLAEYARDNHADLLVTGGFGHSRMRETFFGGVTNELIRRPPLPILLMH